MSSGKINRKIYVASFFIIALLILGAVNIYKKIAWKEPTDGVHWEARPNGLTAVGVQMNSPAYLNGIKKGDILYSINKDPIKDVIGLTKNLWIAGNTGQKVIYQVSREGELINPSFYLTSKGVNLVYFYLALVGLTTIIISMVVFFSSRKQLSLPYIYFYLVSVTFFAFYTFSPTGKLDTLDSAFYWIDKFAFLAFPPLLLHFFLIFPQRKRFLKNKPFSIFFVYLPGLALFAGRIGFHLPFLKPGSDAGFLRFQGTLERLDVLHFGVFTLATLATCLKSYLQPQSVLIKKQLKWIVYGLGLGVVPFTLLYIVPFIFNRTPPRAAELTVLLQGLMPLTFAYSISRYKLMDFEVLLKKAATLIFSFFVIACVYVIVSSQTKIFSENRFNALILGILAIILGATLFTPLKKLFQTLLDRVIYRRSYEYRKTLLFISKELSRERNLQILSQSLLESIAKALSLRSISLLLAEENDNRAFRTLKKLEDRPAAPDAVRFDEQLYSGLREKDYISYYSYSDRRELQRSFETLSGYGFFHFLPLKVEDKIIGCLAMGKKQDGSFLTSEDWELLTTISPSVALALENAYLYSQESIRTQEMQRLKDYSENIIENLTVGVAVIDQDGKIIGWNRILEEQFDVKKNAVLNKPLAEALGPKNFASLFPSDTQQDFRLLSEIRLETPRATKIFDIAKTPLLDNALRPYGTIIVFEDITEKINLQQQLLTSEKLASIGLLSAGVAHEINTPLTGISSYVQMLQKKLTDTHYTQILEKIETQTDRVGRIIKNLLIFARNPSDSSFHRIDLKESLEEIISLIDYKLKNMNIQLDLRLAALPPVYAQGERLQQVFINIILNALDAMPSGGSLKIELERTPDEAVIRITDTGTGVKAEHLPHIFDPFFTTKGIGKGTGLGLSISYAIIKEHEGHIQVESEAGKGTAFTIYIPLDLHQRIKEKNPTPRTNP
ncbi:MAG: ATP-binding protein [Acidobacteriota bacterium]|nr:ATP-binding protein [Acidobacteriota bacterium]